MEGLLLLVGILFLALLIGALLGWIAFLRTGHLRREIAEMQEAALDQRRRIVELETAATFGKNAAAGPVAEAEPTVGEDVQGADIPAGFSEEPQFESTAPSAEVAEPAAAARPAAPAEVTRPRPDFEESVGTRWAVWVGGFALALGGIFMVRYSIEAGLLGPGARIAAGVLFAALLLGAGEWLRRSGLADSGDERIRRAYVPGVLTAAGIVAGFATVYAAYALYGFLSDLPAFLVLGATAFGALALSLLHGPAIAGLGLAASYATPLLVSSAQPSFGALSIYLLLVTAATLVLARLRTWRWLAITAVAGSVGWSLLMIAASGFAGFDGPVTAFHLAVSFALALAVFVVSIHPLDPGNSADPRDRLAVGMLSLFGLPVLFHLAVFGSAPAGVALQIAFGATCLCTAYAFPALRGLAFTAVAVILVGYGAFDAPHLYDTIDPVTGGVISPDLGALLASGATGRLVGAAVLQALLFGALGLFLLLGSAARVPLAVAATTIPLGLLVFAYLRIAGFEVNFAFAALGLALGGYFALATEGLIRRLDPREPGSDGAIAVFAVAAVAALATGLSIGLEKGMLTIALALVVPAIAWVEVARPVQGLRAVAAAAAIVVAIRVGLDPAIVGTELGTTPIFNWLLYGYGVPAAAFGYAAWRFGRTRMDRWVALFEALAVVFTTLTVVMLIHHAMNGGNLFAPVSGLAEQSLLSSALLAVSLGLQWLALRRPGVVFAKGTLLVGALGLLLAGFGLAGTHNPLLSGEPIDGGPFDATLLVGYLLPALLSACVALIASRRSDRPEAYVRLAAALSGVLVFLWATLAVRAGWHTGNLAWGTIEENELYAYSAVWLALSLAVLGVGVVAGSRTIRTVAAALVMLVVVKVFLLDSAGLTGALRALSFIGLGVVLVLVGLAYQKLLGRTRPPGASA